MIRAAAKATVTVLLGQPVAATWRARRRRAIATKRQPAVRSRRAGPKRPTRLRVHHPSCVSCVALGRDKIEVWWASAVCRRAYVTACRDYPPPPMQGCEQLSNWANGESYSQVDSSWALSGTSLPRPASRCTNSS
jgi:hypothetical protein